MAEEAYVQGLCMFPSASEPGGDGGLTVAENPFSRRRVQSFGQCRQHNCDLLGGGFQTVQGGVTPGCESGVAGRASKGLDPLGMTMPAISDEGVDLSIAGWDRRTPRCSPGWRAPRRLFTSRQGRTGKGTDSTT